MFMFADFDKKFTEIIAFSIDILPISVGIL